MPLRLSPDQTVGFREDLTYEPGEMGFSVQSAFCSHSFTGQAWTQTLGILVAEGTKTPTEIIGILTHAGADILGVGGTFQELFEKGLLDDDPGNNNKCGSGAAS